MRATVKACYFVFGGDSRIVLLTMGVESVTVDCGQATKLIEEGSHRDWWNFVVQLRCSEYEQEGSCRINGPR